MSENKAISSKCPAPLSGRVKVPGDKSISHRAIMFGAMALGETRVSGLLEGEDVLSTAAAMRAMGAEVNKLEDGTWQIFGVGVGGFSSPVAPLDMGNSGTSTRLLIGALASQPVTAIFTGDASLSKRPMGRVIKPAEMFGAAITARDGGLLPLTLQGASVARPIEYVSPVASAQVKSAVLLGGLCAPGITTVIEPKATRDHSERMLTAFGATVRTEECEQGFAVSVAGEPELMGQQLTVPADPSSAAFPAVAALLVEGSSITLENVLTNPTRTGLYQTLADMGANITFTNAREEGGETVADIEVAHSVLKGIEVPPERAPSMIDEFPILFAAAALAEGKTTMRGLEELRVKESDRLSVMATGLKACGVRVEELEDGLIIEGTGGSALPGGAEIATHLDHRIAMSFLTLGLACNSPVTVDDASPIETSFPGFADLMQGLGATIRGTNG